LRRSAAWRKKNRMQFLRRHQYLLCFLAVLVLACVMVVRQFAANQSAHIERREDFIFLVQQGKNADHLYQVLIQELPEQSEKSLVEDLERTAPLINTNGSEQDDNLILKYHAHVKKTLEEKSEKRLGAGLKRAEEK
jgi:Tfp pilus assembly protein PilN